LPILDALASVGSPILPGLFFLTLMLMRSVP
jgi:hypothetical protein